MRIKKQNMFALSPTADPNFLLQGGELYRAFPFSKASLCRLTWTVEGKTLKAFKGPNDKMETTALKNTFFHKLLLIPVPPSFSYPYHPLLSKV